MNIASRTPEGMPNECPICGQVVCVEHSSFPTNDAPCPHCGHLLWFRETDEADYRTALRTGVVSRLIAQHHFSSGVTAMAAADWPRAIDSLTISVNYVSADVAYRQFLRASQRKKHRRNKFGSILTFLKHRKIRQEIEEARKAENWALVDNLCERGLAINPWDGAYHADLAEAAFQQGHLEVANFAYQLASKSGLNLRKRRFQMDFAKFNTLRRNNEHLEFTTLTSKAIDVFKSVDQKHGAISIDFDDDSV